MCETAEVALTNHGWIGSVEAERFAAQEQHKSTVHVCVTRVLLVSHLGIPLLNATHHSPHALCCSGCCLTSM